MRNYEGLFILRPKLSKETVNSAINRLEEVISKNGGKILGQENWGKRQLAYKIKKENEGYYLLVNFQLEPAALKAVTNSYKLIDDILRTLILVKNKNK